jgi:long-chain acyl-CoA synthetase
MDTPQTYLELRNKTLPGLLLERASKTPSDVAYRTKKLGIYQERTWSAFYRMVVQCSMGLMKLGLNHGDHVALMGDPCEEYVICELAAQALGAITFGIYPTSSPKEISCLVNDGKTSFFVAQNQEYVDRILPFFDQISHLKYIIVIDTRGIFMYNHRALVPFEKLMKDGAMENGSADKLFKERVSKIKPSDGSFIVYTSGTEGSPKGVLISQGKHIAGAYTLIDRYPILANFPHRTVAFLPLCHVLGKDIAITLPLLTRITPHYGENIEDLGQTIFETAPTVLFTTPRYLQKFVSGILVGIEKSSPLKKWMYKLGLSVGRRYIRNVWDGEKHLLTKLLYFVFYWAAFRPILNKIGFNQLKIALSSGAPLPPEVMALWQIYGVNLSEFYGQTETGGALISAQSPQFPRPGNVGFPPTGWEIKLSETGEILVRGEDIFECYLNNPDLTKEVVDQEGWLHTGDVGQWTSEGGLRIVDRAKDIIVTSGGKTLSPTLIENALKASHYISEAIVFGHKRKYVSALIEIAYETVSDWARLKNFAYTGFASLALHPEVVKFVGSEIEKANQDLSRVEQVKCFRIIPEELNPEEDGGPVTPTRKVKRDLIYEKFRDLVESMYGDKEEEKIVSEVGDLLK